MKNPKSNKTETDRAVRMSGLIKFAMVANRENEMTESEILTALQKDDPSATMKDVFSGLEILLQGFRVQGRQVNDGAGDRYKLIEFSIGEIAPHKRTAANLSTAILRADDYHAGIQRAAVALQLRGIDATYRTQHTTTTQWQGAPPEFFEYTVNTLTGEVYNVTTGALVPKPQA